MDIELPDLNAEGPNDDVRAVRDTAEETFGARATKRINSLLSRAKSAEARAEGDAATVADLRRQLHQQAAQRIGADEQVIQGRQTETERALRTAKEAGDLDGEVKAQRELMALEVSLTHTRIAKSQADHAVANAPQQQAKPAMSSAMKTWLDDGNAEWFNKDDAMTTSAVGFDKAARSAGIEPESQEYFKFIDKKMRASFADHFDGGSEGEDEVEDEPEPVRESRPVSAAPARRSTTPHTTPQSARTVRLTAEESEVAKALGMTPQAYAANKTANY